MALQTELETNHSFGEIIGKSEKMQQLFTQIQTAAAGDITVLIQGETGTGKELVAKSIHNNSPRKSAPFVGVNCAAIPAELIESQLFGQVNAGLSPGQSSGGSDILNKRTPAHFSLMKLERCNYLYKRSCCVSYKNGSFKGSGAQAPSPLTSGSWLLRIKI